MQTVHLKGLTALRTNQNKYDYFIRFKGKNHQYIPCLTKSFGFCEMFSNFSIVFGFY